MFSQHTVPDPLGHRRGLRADSGPDGRGLSRGAVVRAPPSGLARVTPTVQTDTGPSVQFCLRSSRTAKASLHFNNHV